MIRHTRSEPITNVGLICTSCASKTNPIIAFQPLDWFMGKVVKLDFPTGREEGPKGELMWVDVTGIREDGTMIGTLANDPFFIDDLRNGDEIEFNRDEIRDVRPASE